MKKQIIAVVVSAFLACNLNVTNASTGSLDTLKNQISIETINSLTPESM